MKTTPEERAQRIIDESLHVYLKREASVEEVVAIRDGIANEIRVVVAEAQAVLTEEWRQLITTILEDSESSRAVVKEVEFKDGVEGHPYYVGKSAILRYLLKQANLDAERFSTETNPPPPAAPAA